MSKMEDSDYYFNLTFYAWECYSGEEFTSKGECNICPRDTYLIMNSSTNITFCKPCDS